MLKVPLDRLLAFKLVKLTPDRRGKTPALVSWTSWPAPLKALPCKVVVGGRALRPAGVATGAAVPLEPATGLILGLGIQPAIVQTVTLLMTRPSLLSEVVPPEAAKVPLAWRSPATCKVVSPFSGAPVS